MKVLSDKQAKFLGLVLCCTGGFLLAFLLALVVYLLNLALDLFGGVFWSIAVSGMLAILLRPVICIFEEKMKLGRIQAILALYTLVILFFSSLFWFFGGKVLNQTKEIAGSVGEWPTLLEMKAEEKLPPELWDGISSHLQAFNEYWSGLVGEKQDSVFAELEPEQKNMVFSLPAEDRKVFAEFDISEKNIQFIFDDNKLKHGLCIPGTKINILNPSVLNRKKINVLIIFAWNYADIIIKKNKKFQKKGGKFLIPFPKPRLL